MIEKKWKTTRPEIHEVGSELRFIETAEVPSAIVWHLISRYRKEMQAADRNHQQRYNRFLGKIALPVFYLNQLVDRAPDKGGTDTEAARVKQIRLIQSLISSVLNKEGVEITGLDGRRWQDVDEGEAEMVDYITDETLQEPMVRETCEPVVKKQAKIIRPGKVIVAGPPTETSSETEE